MFKNRVLRRIFRSKRDEVTGEYRKLNNEGLSDLYFLPNIIQLIKSRIMKKAGHVARIGREETCIQGVWWGSLREGDNVGERIILKCIFKRDGSMERIDLAG